MNSHYIPQFILRNFCNDNGNLVYCDFDNKTTSVRNTRSVFSEEGYYPDRLEKDLSKQLEHSFANLYHNKLENAKDSIVLTRDEMFTIQKFLIASSIRYKYELTDNDKRFLNAIPKEYRYLYEINSLEGLDRILDFNDYDELVEYINHVIDTRYSPNPNTYKDSDVNLQLFIEAREVLSNYLIFVRPSGKEEFLIPDIGRGAYSGKMAVDKIMFSFYMMINDPNEISLQLPKLLSPRDFMLYPITKDLAIISMSVFYKLVSEASIERHGIQLRDYSESLGFLDNTILNPSSYLKNDCFHYKIKRINLHDVCHLNCISINQSKHFIACSDLSKIQQSISFAKVNIERDVSFLQL